MDEQSASLLVASVCEEYRCVLLRYACRLVGRRDDAEDIVQEAFLHLYQNIRFGRHIEHPRAWLLCVVRRSAGNYARVACKQRQRHEPSDAVERLSDTSASLIEQECDSAKIFELFQVLTPRELEVVLLRVESLKYREIADRLGISSKSVCTLLARALRKLQRAAAVEGQHPQDQYVDERIPKTLQ